MFGGTFQWLSILVKERAKHGKCRYLGKRVQKSRPESGNYIQITAARLNEWKQAGTVHPLSTSKDRIQISRIINYKNSMFSVARQQQDT